jgi:AraC-like DNA-binding protein
MNMKETKHHRSKEMSGDTSWAAEAPAINHNACFEIEDATSVKTAADNSEFCGSRLPRIIGNGAALQRVLRLVRLVAPTDATVLIQGATGTGRELIAEAIHKSSDRSNCPFVKVNCAAIPAGLLESELFGHERGAYTGPVARSIGQFERANRGTLFLDEIGDLPLELQPKLLRVMQERQFERLGGAATIHTDVRVICATHRNLIEMTEEQQFRADLFYRLSVFPITLPPLRERSEDTLRTLARSLTSDRPKVWYELDRCDSLYELGSSPRLEEIVGSREPRERVLEHVRKPASLGATVNISEGTQVPLRSPCGKLQRRLLQRVLDRMKLDLSADLDLNTLAAESGYSRSHFLRTFRAAIGCSPHQWLTRLRVEQAKTILREQSISLIDIALACGFSSHAHFSNTFRQIIGVTPSEYRRSHSPDIREASFFAST